MPDSLPEGPAHIISPNCILAITDILPEVPYRVCFFVSPNLLWKGFVLGSFFAVVRTSWSQMYQPITLMMVARMVTSSLLSPVQASTIQSPSAFAHTNQTLDRDLNEFYQESSSSYGIHNQLGSGGLLPKNGPPCTTFWLTFISLVGSLTF